jgi:hypothetical protein
MKTVYKYEIPFGDEATVEIPERAILLKYGVQGVNPQTKHPCICVWALVDTEITKTEQIRFAIHGTGHPLPDNCTWTPAGDQGWFYQDTVFDREFVWHIFSTEWLAQRNM